MDRKEDLTRIRRLLGEAAVLLPNKAQKGCFLPGWQHLTKNDADKFEAKLLAAPMVGVLLGPTGGDLYSIDVDDDGAFEVLLKLNPTLHERALITRGARGGNIWLRIRSEAPPTAHLVDANGNPWGEWRGARGQTIISGCHPSGVQYRDNGKQPLELAFDQIRWPQGLMQSGKGKLKRSWPGEAGGRGGGVSSAPSTISRLPSSTIARYTTARQQGTRISDELYETLVSGRFPTPRPSNRNTLLTQMAPFLFRNLSPSAYRAVIERHYRENANTFNDCLEAHLRSAGGLYRGCAVDYPSELEAYEEEIYRILDEMGQAAFRICRSLAGYAGTDAPPPPRFFLTCGSLAERLGCRSGEAHRELQRLVREGAMNTVDRGCRRQKGRPGKAAVFHWNYGEPTADDASMDR